MCCVELSRTEKSVKNALYAVLLQLITIASNFVTKTILVRYMGIQYAGISALFTDILDILSIAELGFGTALGYALYRPLAEKDDLQIAKLMAFYRKIYTGIMLVIVSCGLLCLPLLKYIVRDIPDVEDNISVIFLLYVLKTATSYFLIYKSILLDANQQKNVVSKITIVTRIVISVAEALILAKFRNYYLYMVCVVLLVIVSNVLVSARADRLIPIQPLPKGEQLSREEKRKLYKNVFALAIYKVNGTLQRNVDSIIISMFMGTSVVGLLANYRMVIYRTNHLFGQIIEEMRASTGNLAVSGDGQQQYAVYRKMRFLAFAIGNLICTALFVLIDPFVTIWLGEAYVLETAVTALLVTDVYIMTMARTYENFRIANALFIQGKIRPAVMVVINIVLSILWGKQYGVPGVLLATVVTRVSTHVWFDPWLLHRHVFQKPFAPYLVTVGIRFLIFAANCAVTYFVSRRIDTGNQYADFVLMTLLALILPLLLFVLEFYKTPDFVALRQSIRALIKKKPSPGSC